LFKECNETESKVLEVEVAKHPLYFENQTHYTYFTLSLEENTEIRPFLLGEKQINISLVCSILEMMNMIFAEFLENGKNFLTRSPAPDSKK